MVIFVENDKLKSKQRYRDSKVVANKGEKYIVEKEEEYDSGQRGRVRPRKRGPGLARASRDRETQVCPLLRNCTLVSNLCY